MDLISIDQALPPGNPTGFETSYYLYDGLGSIRGLTDTNGTLTDRYDYDAWGNLIDTIGATPNTYLYTGEQYDLDLGFYYLRARYMDPNRGRFWTMDVWEGWQNQPLSRSGFAYANMQPTKYRDPSGHMSLSEQGMVTVLVGTLVVSVGGALIPKAKSDECSKWYLGSVASASFSVFGGAAFVSQHFVLMADPIGKIDRRYTLSFFGFGFGKGLEASGSIDTTVDVEEIVNTKLGSASADEFGGIGMVAGFSGGLAFPVARNRSSNIHGRVSVGVMIAWSSRFLPILFVTLPDLSERGELGGDLGAFVGAGRIFVF